MEGLGVLFGGAKPTKAPLTPMATGLIQICIKFVLQVNPPYQSICIDLQGTIQLKSAESNNQRLNHSNIFFCR